MDKKEQLNQNPEIENLNEKQEEKTLTTDNTVEEIENVEKQEVVQEKQITDADKSEIKELLLGKVVKPVKLKKPAKVEKPELIQVEEKEAVEAPEEKEEVIVEVDNRQISDEEKESIILMLHEKSEHYHEDHLIDIEFDKLNKQELVDVLEDIVQEKDISIIKSQVAKINSAFYQHNKEDKENEKNNFLSSGGILEDFVHNEDPLEIRFNAALGKYRHNKAKFSQELEKQKQVNLQLKYELLEDLKNLVNSEETLKKTYDEFKILQDRWKEIGMVPATELRNLWQSYHFLVEKFFDKVRINRELRDLDLKKNLELKVELCEKAEELLVEKSILKSFKLLQHYHDKWREIGPVPTDVKEDIWERFKGITDNINLRRKDYYKELQDQQQGNYEAKVALCEKAKEIVEEPVDTLKGWQSLTDKMNELLKLWKTIGRAPKAKNDEVWETFKGFLDSFFNAKREYLGELKEQQVNNYNLKLELCTKAEAIKDSNDWGKATRELIKLQKDWKEIGPVPRKYSDKIWKRFRSICDEFFKRKSEHFKGLHATEETNLKSKKACINKIADYKLSKDKDANLTALKEFQNEWIEIGFVPFKEKDKVQAEYRAAIDLLISKMDINKSELTTNDFKDKVDILKSGPDSDRRISKERNFISGKIRSIKEDLSVWENNIGFFANSKQSNKLKEEFERKIDKAKQEIEGLKTRLKIIDSE